MQTDHRLRRHADYQTVYKRGRKYQAKTMSYFYTVRAGATAESGSSVLPPTIYLPAPGPRVGLTVGKVLGNAVVRNRIKRRLRSAVRMHIALLDTLDVDVALHPRKTAQDMDWRLLEQDVATVFRTIAKMATSTARTA